MVTQTLLLRHQTLPQGLRNLFLASYKSSGSTAATRRPETTSEFTASPPMAMAAFVDRQLPQSSSSSIHRSDSPRRGCAFPPLISPQPRTPSPPPAADDDDTDDDDNQLLDWRSLYSPNLDVPEPVARDKRDEGCADDWIDRHPSLIRLTGKHPFNSEPPLARLMSHGFITPVPLHYVRNHGAVPRADWAAWSVEVSGLVRRPQALTMDQLLTQFPPLELPVTLVCAGNRRKEQNMAKQSVGFNWGPSAVSTSVWRGARLRDVLLRCGIRPRRDGALHVWFEGDEDLAGGGGSKYGTSLPREVAMDPARDVMLAYEQNGEQLKPDHGFPVRVIIPGFIGGRMVKWLKRIVVAGAESDNYYHFHDNRVFPSHVDAELAADEGWWQRPEYIINELNINSVITTPGHEEVLPINALSSDRPFTVKGYAYSGGGRKVTRVEITLDGGETWRICAVEHPEKPTKYGKHWCWCFWSVAVEVADLLNVKEIAVRAWDESLNTQPDKLIWNLMGMMNNCWFRVKVNVCWPHRGEIGLMFEHPTQPGVLPGGWMAKQKQSVAGQLLKKSVSSPFMNTSAKQFTMSEVRRHSTADSAWIVVHGHVYDCTAFLKGHPGGRDSILNSAGTDCTEDFDAIHSDKAKAMLETYRIGELLTTGYTSDGSVHGAANLSHLATIAEPPPAVALANPRQKVPCRLVSKKRVSDNVRLFRFALPERDQLLGLPIGKHVFVAATVENKLCMRAYTPTSPADEAGHMDLLIKVYPKGAMSQHLDALPLGASIDIKGPLGHIEYAGRGTFLVSGKRRTATKLTMIAGGTGITPMYQLIQAVLRDQPADTTEMHLVYANCTEADVLLREELDRWAAEFPDRLKVWYVVSNPAAPASWKYSIGYVTEEILREHAPPPGEGTLALACGPPPMIEFAVKANLAKLGYDLESSLLVF